MQKRFLILLFISLIFIVPAAQAQGPLRLAEFEVDLWPEYDRPDVLVIYKAKLPADVSLPVNVTLMIPAVAGEPHAVAVRQMDGALLNAAYDRQVEGDWALITITATMPEIQLEYYDPQITVDGSGKRDYTYMWPGNYAVDAMRFIIQQPISVNQMSVEPNLGTFIQIQGDPMQYYAMDVGSPKAGEKVSVDVSYFKDSDILSIESLQVQPSDPISGDTGSSSELVTFLPWVIGGLGVLLLVGGGIWYWRMNSVQSSPTPKRSRKTKAAIKSPEQVSAENGNQGVFCHQCGKRAGANDRFCRSCGAKLRGG